MRLYNTNIKYSIAKYYDDILAEFDKNFKKIRFSNDLEEFLHIFRKDYDVNIAFEDGVFMIELRDRRNIMQAHVEYYEVNENGYSQIYFLI